MPMVEAFRMADQVLYQGVDGITSLITTPGLINLDFADVKTVMAGAGSALMGIGIGSGADRATEAAKSAISSPLLESSIDGAKGVLLSIAGPTDLTLHEVNAAADAITRVAHPDANIIFGAVVDDALGDEVRVTVVAAGFDKVSPAADNRFESRLSRLLEEPVRTRPPRKLAPVDPAGRRGGRVRDRGRTGVGVVRRGGGPGHPRLPEELAAIRRPARSRARGAGRPSDEAPFPRLVAPGPPRPSLMLRHMPASRDEIVTNLREIREAIRSAAERAGRDPAAVELVAAAKTVPPEPIRWVVEAGVRSIGHNYVHELRASREALPDLEVRWHYIGTLQGGTAHQVADAADVVQTVGGERAARRLAGRAARSGRVLDVLIEVDLTGARSGVPPSAPPPPPTSSPPSEASASEGS